MGYDCNRLIKLQKRIIRTISRSKYHAHTNPLFKELFILKLPDIVSLNALKYTINTRKMPSQYTSPLLIFNPKAPFMIIIHDNPTISEHTEHASN